MEDLLGELVREGLQRGETEPHPSTPLEAQPSEDEDADPARVVLAFRTSEAIRAYVDGAEVSRYSQQGVVTPDHTIRTKNWPLVLPAPEAGLGGFAMDAWTAVDEFQSRYRDYFARNDGKREGQPH